RTIRCSRKARSSIPCTTRRWKQASTRNSSPRRRSTISSRRTSRHTKTAPATLSSTKARWTTRTPLSRATRNWTRRWPRTSRPPASRASGTTTRKPISTPISSSTTNWPVNPNPLSRANMRVLRFGIFASLALVLLLAACTRSVLIGSDFLDDEQSLIQFRDDLGLTFHTQRTDSILVHSDNVSRQLSTYMVGRITDPIFGRYEAEIFAQPVLPTVGTQLLG